MKKYKEFFIDILIIWDDFKKYIWLTETLA